MAESSSPAEEFWAERERARDAYKAKLAAEHGVVVPPAPPLPRFAFITSDDDDDDAVPPGHVLVGGADGKRRTMPQAEYAAMRAPYDAAVARLDALMKQHPPPPAPVPPMLRLERDAGAVEAAAAAARRDYPRGKVLRMRTTAAEALFTGPTSCFACGASPQSAHRMYSTQGTVVTPAGKEWGADVAPFCDLCIETPWLAACDARSDLTIVFADGCRLAGCGSGWDRMEYD